MEYIQHTGRVNNIENGKVSVSLSDSPACTSCSLKNSCGFSSGSDPKNLEIFSGDKVEVGDEVIVRITQRTGFAAVMLSYLVPVLLVLATLIVLLSARLSEALSGLLSIMVLLPYYGLIAMTRKTLNKHLQLEILHNE